MRWSQLKRQLQGRFASSIAGYIALHQTRYRHAHDQEGEFWISFGGQRIFSAGSLSYLSSLGKLTAKNRADGLIAAQSYTLAWPVMDASGLFLLEQMNKDLFCSLGLTVEQMLEHDNPVVRALAILDARYGKRRLGAFDPASEHHLVQTLHRLRCEAEDIPLGR